MTENLALRAGHDIRYHTNRAGGGHAGGMAYYTEAMGEPPGQWAGKAAAKLGLAGVVDAEVIRRLFHEDVGPDGDRLAARKRGKYDHVDVAAAVEAYKAEHPYASEVELAEVRSAARSQNRNGRPYFDFALSAVKSVSLLQASLIIAAKVARDEGDLDTAASLEAEAADIEQAQYDVAENLVREIEASAAYTRTGGHHGRDKLGHGTTGEWRDADGVAAGIFVQHTSHEGDPHLHAHVTVWNRVQRADGADDKYRTLDSRSLYAQRLRLAAMADRDMETRMTALSWPMVAREDGNGAEVAGVNREVINRFSTRRVKMVPEIEKLKAEYEERHGHPPNARALWLMKQHVSMKQRAASPKGGDWEKQVTEDELRMLAGVHESVRAAKGGAIPVLLDDQAKAKAARIAVAEVQKRHTVWTMAQLMFEVHRALPVMAAGTDSKALITEVAKLAVSGRAGTDVVQVTAPDITDVSSLGVRISDGGSIYRPPQEERWTTLPHLNTEELILDTAKREVPQLVTEEEAWSAVADTDLNAEQAEAVVMMLTANTMTTALVAPAGSGKSHTMAVYARIWTAKTGRRVIGLTTSTNAARVLQNEGLAESYNIAEFLGKIEGSTKLRHPVPLHENDVLVLDEATQAGTADLAMVQEAARVAGARLNPVGDTQQLGAPEAGGMFRLLAQEVPAAELHEILRFDAEWEAEASLQLRDGDFAAVAAYDRRGRVHGADREAAFDRAASLRLADLLDGKNGLLVAGSNPEAAELSRRVQEKLVTMGRVSEPVVNLSDGNLAGVGDLIRARLNTTIDAGGQKLTNRDTLKVTGLAGRAAEVIRLRLDGTWTSMFRVPRAYLADSAELDYAGNTHVAEGRTVDRGRLLASETLSRNALYVGMTRGREENTVVVVTGETAPAGKKPYEQATPESVLRGIMQREAEDLSAIEQIRISQEWSGGTGHVLNLWSSVTRGTLYPQIDDLIKARLTPAEAKRYDREHARGALQSKLREHQLAGHDIAGLVERITSQAMDGARSVSSVLHGRLEQVSLPDPGDVTWAARTPEGAPQLAHELAAGLDERRAALGERLIEKPEPWLTDHLGVLAHDASPVLREDYARRASAAAAYREAAGITDPRIAISAEPHNSPELEMLRKGTFKALEIRDEAALLRAAARGDLEARVLDGERAQAAAPPEVSSTLRLTAKAEADARVQAAEAQARKDEAEAQGARQLAETLGIEKARLEVVNSAYEKWAARTAEPRDLAGKAKAELDRRGQAPDCEPAVMTEPPVLHPSTEPQQTMTEWWAEFEEDAAGVESAISREHEAAVEAGEPWPPERKPEARPEPEPEPEEAPDDSQAARIGRISEQVAEAKSRLAAETEHLEASDEYQARIAREAEPEAVSENEPA